VHRGKEQGDHFNHHAERTEDDQSFPANGIGQGTGGNFEENDRDRPDPVKNAKFFPGQTVFQKEQGKNRVVKPGIEKHPETDEPGKISIHLPVRKRIVHE
jgi:hypothetical protein